MAVQSRRQAYGQHFLSDKRIVDRLLSFYLEAAHQASCASLIEIGPGRGALTLPLLTLLDQNPLGFSELQAIEKDGRLIKKLIALTRLSERPPQSKHAAGVHALFPFSLKEADFLRLESWDTPLLKPIAVLSNLPYSSAVRILVGLARQHKTVSVMLLMFQQEVAQKLRAQIGEKKRGSLTVWLQNCWEVEKVLSVEPQAFFPPPKVFSQVLVFRPRAISRLSEARELAGDTKKVEENLKADLVESIWEQVLRLCFAQKRKMLRSFFPWPEVLKASAVDPSLRAEALTWDDWRRLLDAAIEFRGI